MALLDIMKAFDSVWHDALLHKLKLNGYPAFLIKIISSFLSERQSFVSINGSDSQHFKIPAGVPQGSPLSPHLFNVFINDIPITDNCKLAVFADDTALLSSMKNYDLPLLVDRMEKGLSRISNHFEEWKIKLNPSKTETILFTKSPKMRKLQESHAIHFNGNKLPWKLVTTYLGAHLDSKLSMKVNIERNLSKAQKALSVIYCFMRKYSRVKTQFKLLMYKSYIRPIFTYA